MARREDICKFCGHPEEDHTSKLFHEYKLKYKDTEKAWKVLKEIHPKLLKCFGFKPADKN